VRAQDVIRDCVATFPFAQLRVTGTCMEPHLYEGQTVRLVHPSRRAPRFGDVALVERADGALRLHRLIWPLLTVSVPRWRSKPDRGPWMDGPIQLIATVAQPERLGGLAAGLRSLMHGIWCRIRENLSR
jgi:hypothetical protein